MNEQIKRLVKRAGGHFDTHCLASNPVQYRESIQMWDEHIEKFAELIVRECASIIDAIPTSPQGAWSDGYYEGCRDSSKAIQEHFGVE